MRVLLADDSPSFTSAAIRFLSLIPECEVVGRARTGREAIEQVNRLHPDLVLMDVRMPEMDGLEATQRIKRGIEPPQVIVMTLHNHVAYRRRAEQAGADGFVGKEEFGTASLELLTDFDNRGGKPS
ncbi:MAG: response regulator transcription factor [Gammaproteobacteria bacterium]|nr:response regulator transcription factor [Gammaproteobacteria bacterium]